MEMFVSTASQVEPAVADGVYNSDQWIPMPRGKVNSMSHVWSTQWRRSM